MTSKLVWVDGRAFIDYREWECYQHGFYRKLHECSPDHVTQSKALLCNCDAFWSAMKRLVNEWPNTTAVHLTNCSINRRAWLGQTSCFFLMKCCRVCVVTAWFQMEQEQRAAANETATEMIEEWIQKHSGLAYSLSPKRQLEFQFLRLPLRESSVLSPSAPAFM